MKPSHVITRRDPFGVNGLRGPIRALLAGLGLLGASLVPLHAQAPSIERSVLLSWPEPAEEQIVVVAESVTSTLRVPWPEPVFRRHGRFCMAVPTTADIWFATLVPGSQCSEDFRASGPAWIPWFLDAADAGAFAFTASNGVFEVQAVAQPKLGQVALFPADGGQVVGDFHASVDLLGWFNNGESALGLAGRIQGGTNGIASFYLGSVRMNPAAGTGQLWFFDGAADVPASIRFNVQADSDYRLEFSAVATHLKLRLLDLRNPANPVAEGILEASRFSQGRVALWVNTRGSALYGRTLDNFFVTGTKP